MKVFNRIELKIDVLNKRLIAVHFNISLFLEPEVKVRNKIISTLHDIDSLAELITSEEDECCDEECEGCDKCEDDEEYEDCESLIDMIQNINGIDDVSFGGHEIIIYKGEFFFSWESILTELIQILLLHHDKSTGEARLVKIEFKDSAKKDIGKENLESFIKKFPKKYRIEVSEK